MNFSISDIGVLVSIVAALAGLIWVMFNLSLKPIKDDVKEIKHDLKAEKEITSKMREDYASKFAKLEHVPSMLSSLNETILNIRLFLISKHEDASGTLSVVRSPRQLNESGEKLYKESGAKVVLEGNMNTYISKMEVSAPQSALDVEGLALSTLYSCSNNEEFIPLKNYVYNNSMFGNLSII